MIQTTYPDPNRVNWTINFVSSHKVSVMIKYELPDHNPAVVQVLCSSTAIVPVIIKETVIDDMRCRKQARFLK